MIDEKKLTIEDIKEEVKLLDKNLNENSEEFKIATMFLSAIQVSSKLDEIVKFMNIDKKEIKKYHTICIKEGIFTKEGLINANWCDDESGVVAFWADVLTVQGYLSRSTEK